MGLLAKTAHHDVHCTTASHAGLFTHSGDTSGCLALGSAPLLPLNPLSMFLPFWEAPHDNLIFCVSCWIIKNTRFSFLFLF